MEATTLFNEKTKVCKRCGRELPMSAFGYNNETKDKKQSWCKECHIQYNRTKRAGEAEQERIANQQRWDRARGIVAEILTKDYEADPILAEKVIDIARALL